jgi:urease accessory protein
MKRQFLLTTSLLLLLASGAASAHPGHGTGSGFLSGMLHPLTGIDHLFVILSFGLMTGLWAAKRAGRLIGGFVALFVASAYLGSLGAMMAGMEALITSTVIAAALIMLIKPLRGNQMVIMLFGLIAAITHGYVHGVELSAAHSLSWLAGASLSITILLICAMSAARMITNGKKGYSLLHRQE